MDCPDPQFAHNISMLCSNRGSGQSVDCPVQAVDPRFAQQSMDCLHKLWIHALCNTGYGYFFTLFKKDTRLPACLVHVVPVSCQWSDEISNDELSYMYSVRFYYSYTFVSYVCTSNM